MFHLDHLPDQRPNEHVVLFLRRQWFAVLTIVVAFVVLTGVPIVVGGYFWDSIETWLAHPILGPLIIIVGTMYFLAIWLSVFLEFTDYYLDTWIVTTQRIINIEQEGLFHRTASELDLAAVQDTTAKIDGFLQTMFTFGDVFVQTAGRKEHFHFRDIVHPERVKQVINKLVEEDKQRLAAGGSMVMGKVKTGTK